jgi:hypothetical protein
LEHALGVRLLDRSRRGVEPTPYGRALTKRGVAILRQGIEEIEFLSDPTAGEVRIGATRRRKIELAELLSEPWVLDSPNTDFGAMQARVCLTRGKSRLVNFAIDSASAKRACCLSVRPMGTPAASSWRMPPSRPRTSAHNRAPRGPLGQLPRTPKTNDGPNFRVSKAPKLDDGGDCHQDR